MDHALEQAIYIVQQTRCGDLPKPAIHAIFDPTTHTASYIVRDPTADGCAVIDSVLDFDAASGHTGQTMATQLLAFIARHSLQAQWVLETHVHADHLSAAPLIVDHTSARLAIGSHITTVQDVFGKIFNAGTEFARDGSQFDVLLEDGDTFSIGALHAIALHVPGHTPACMAYVIGDAVFVGDTLFMPDYGTARCDFPGGDARALYRSIRRLLALPDNTRVFVCHDYKARGRDTYAWETTIGEQRRANIHMHAGVSEQDFVTMRRTRDATLSTPALLIPSIQVNMQGGRLPAPEANGVRYLKVPLNTV